MHKISLMVEVLLRRSGIYEYPSAHRKTNMLSMANLPRQVMTNLNTCKKMVLSLSYEVVYTIHTMAD